MCWSLYAILLSAHANDLHDYVTLTACTHMHAVLLACLTRAITCQTAGDPDCSVQMRGIGYSPSPISFPGHRDYAWYIPIFGMPNRSCYVFEDVSFWFCYPAAAWY